MLKDNFHAIGLMSGTSLDGVDLVYVEFDYCKDYSFKIIHSITLPYSSIWKQKLKDAFTFKEESLEKLDVEYGNYLGSLINDFKKKHQINKVDFIASHGHTIFHKPDEGYTLQIGRGQQIANIIGSKVICDFRTQDVKLGGQGAPLVPIGDQLLFSDYDYCLNLGGFANISFEENHNRIAYDICPVNIVLNYYVNQLGLEYDDKGRLASEGNINDLLLEQLNQLPFYKKEPPKSLGYEWVENRILPLIDSFHIETKDVLRTFIEHVALQIVNQFDAQDKSVLVTGGGTFNDFLMKRIFQLSDFEIIIPDKKLIEYKEALIFAFLGLLKLQGKINVLSSVTGAKKDHSSGKIFVPELL